MVFYWNCVSNWRGLMKGKLKFTSFLCWRHPRHRNPYYLGVGVGVGVSTGVGVGVGLGVSVGACVSECVIACVRGCFDKAWAMPEFGCQTWLERRFGKAWAAADIDA